MKRNRFSASPNGYALPNCTSSAGTGAKAHAQFWQHCRDCDVDACLACVSVCHHGHAMEGGQYGGSFHTAEFVCQCAARGRCSDVVYRKASLGTLIGQAGKNRAQLKCQIKDAEQQLSMRTTMAAELELIRASYHAKDQELRTQVMEKASQGKFEELKALVPIFSDHLALAPEIQKKEAEIAASAGLASKVESLKAELKTCEHERANLLNTLEKLV